MQDNWYNSSWYGSNNSYSADTSRSQPVHEESESEKKKKRRTRITALIACLGVIAAAAFGISFFSRDSKNDFSSAEYLPKDWHNYMERYYAATDAEDNGEINIPKSEATTQFSLNVSQGVGKTLSAQEIYAKCAPSIVCLTASDSGKVSTYSWGSGIIISADGYILTNTHIIKGCDTVSVELYNGEKYDATLVGADSLSDISILKIEATGLTPAEFVSSSTLSVGDEVVAIGNPLGETYRLSMTDGIVSGISRQVNYKGAVMNLIQTNAAINEGNSGGALITGAGQIVGITNMKIISSHGVEGIGFAIPSDTVKTIADALLQNGVVTDRGTIGVTIGPIPAPAAEYYKIPQGLYVSAVLEKSDAYAQGIRVGDIITHVNGEEVHQNSDISAVKENLKVGDSLTFTVWRDNDTFDVFDVTVKLMDANDLN